MIDTKILIMPFIGAAIGLFTNWIAVKMLFHPRKKKFGIQGLIPKRKKDIAKRVGEISPMMLPKYIEGLKDLPYVGDKIYPKVMAHFKKGVEFKTYVTHGLAHARAVAIESDREFGLSVLQRIDEELKRRGELFRSVGVQDLAGYKKSGGSERIPRTLLVVDEFQEFLVEDDNIAQSASLLLDRLVRQGRAFGIHVLLGSQTLGGAYALSRTTMGQMVIRIALQCNESDAYLIMDDSNPAPRLLSRPGEAIYNDTAGSVDGNSPFQVVWLPDEVREEHLICIRQMADESDKVYPGPLVFEGNAPGDIRDNLLLSALLRGESPIADNLPRIWLGAPNSIKGPTEVTFHRQSGSNLLVVGQHEEAILSMLGLAVPSFSALCKMRKRIPHWIWEKLLRLTSGMQYEQVAIDGTGLSRTNPSHHYLKRIDGKKVKRYAKLSALFDIKNKKFCALRVRTKPRHDIKDAKYLLKRVEIQKTLFGDTAYDAEWLHELCFDKGVQTQIKPRKNARRGFYRRKQMKNYSDEEYHQRSLIESGFGGLKRKYGGSVLAKKSKGVKTEIYCKAIAHNIGLSN